MKGKALSMLLGLLLASSAVSATEYIYRDLMANSLPSPGCAIEKDAMLVAAKDFNLHKYSKLFCQSQGYGWHVEQIKDNGKTVCTDCAGNKKQCHLEDMVVACKRIKPGSVGMLPGKS